jgi:hypothetical protein
MPKKSPVPTTIGTNPLDLVVSAQPAAMLTGKGKARKPGDTPDTSVLTVTVPSELADELEQIIAITPGANLDTLATEALRIVLAGLKRGTKGSVRPAKGKTKTKSARDAGPTLVIVAE